MSKKNYRRSIRLKNYDYSKSGCYFITICTHNKQQLFDEIVNGKILTNKTNLIIKKYWLKLPSKFANIYLDEFIIMPDHIHGIIKINNVSTVGADPCVCPEKTCAQKGEHTGSSLHRIVQWFKTMTTNLIIQNVKINKIKPFDCKIWQRNYYERVIRNEYELKMIRNYIKNNSKNWEYLD